MSYKNVVEMAHEMSDDRLSRRFVMLKKLRSHHRHPHLPLSRPVQAQHYVFYRHSLYTYLYQTPHNLEYVPSQKRWRWVIATKDAFSCTNAQSSREIPSVITCICLPYFRMILRSTNDSSAAFSGSSANTCGLMPIISP